MAGELKVRPNFNADDVAWLKQACDQQLAAMRRNRSKTTITAMRKVYDDMIVHGEEVLRKVEVLHG